MLFQILFTKLIPENLQINKTEEDFSPKTTSKRFCTYICINILLPSPALVALQCMAAIEFLFNWFFFWNDLHNSFLKFTDKQDWKGFLCQDNKLKVLQIRINILLPLPALVVLRLTADIEFLCNWCFFSKRFYKSYSWTLQINKTEKYFCPKATSKRFCTFVSTFCCHRTLFLHYDADYGCHCVFM